MATPIPKSESSNVVELDAAAQNAARTAPPLPKKSKIELLLDCEAAMRDTADSNELSYLIVNEWRQIVTANQMFLLEQDMRGSWSVTFASDVTKPDARSPLCRSLSALLVANINAASTDIGAEFSLETLATGDQHYPFRYGLLNRIAHAKAVQARFLVTAFARAPQNGDRLILDRLAATAAHAFALNERIARQTLLKRLPKHRLALGMVFAIVAAGFIPVPMTVLAPVEIIAADPFLATAPLDGVIKSIEVNPDSQVEKGDILFHLNNSELKSSYEIARKNADVAEARWRRAQQGASLSSELRREAGLAEAEFAAAVAERFAAEVRMQRSTVRAEVAGTAMFNNKDDWTGKPVSTGERIIEIADPTRIQARIELGLSDSVVLEQPRGITLFMDSNPLAPVTADFVSAAYQATPTRNNTLAFTVRAKPKPEQGQTLRVGQSGTAQIRASRVSLAYFLFRRPLSMVRQRFGV